MVIVLMILIEFFKYILASNVTKMRIKRSDTVCSDDVNRPPDDTHTHTFILLTPGIEHFCCHGDRQTN